MGVTKPNEMLKIRSVTGVGLFCQVYIEKVLHVLTGVSSPRNVEQNSASQRRLVPPSERAGGRGSVCAEACSSSRSACGASQPFEWHCTPVLTQLHPAHGIPYYPELSVECQMLGNHSSCKDTLVQVFPHAWLYLYFSCIVVNPSWFVPLIASVMCLKTE